MNRVHSILLSTLVLCFFCSCKQAYRIDVNKVLPDRIVFITQPSTTTADHLLNTIEIQMRGPEDQVINSSKDARPIRIMLINSEGLPVGLQLPQDIPNHELTEVEGMLSSATRLGTAIFPGLQVTQADKFRLRAIAAGFSAVDSDEFRILPGNPNHLGFAAQPGDALTHETLKPVALQIFDLYKNPIMDLRDGIRISVSLKDAYNRPINTGMNGGEEINSNAGRIEFENLSVNIKGTYRLTGYSADLPIPTANSDLFDISESPIVSSSSSSAASSSSSKAPSSSSTPPASSAGSSVASSRASSAASSVASSVASSAASSAAPVTESKATAVRVQPDGKILIVGVNGGVTKVVSSWWIQRQKSAGLTPDTTFGSSGIFTINHAGRTPFQMDMQGTAIIVGTCNSDDTISVYRIGADGVLDSSFGSGTGYYQLTNRTIMSGGTPSIYDLKVLTGGKILLGLTRRNATMNSSGWYEDNLAIVRLNSNGTLDTTFGNSGFFQYDNDPNNIQVQNGAGLSITSTGDIIAVGSGGYPMRSLLILKVKAQGTLDTLFGTNGAVKLGGGSSSGQNVFVDSTNDIYIYGDLSDQPTVWKIKINGQSLTQLYTDTSGGNFNIFSGSQAFDPVNRKISFIGSSSQPGSWQPVIYRILAAGGLDTSFYGTGIVSLDATGNGTPLALALTSSGAQIAVGYKKVGAVYTTAVWVVP